MGKIDPARRGLVDLSHESHKFRDFEKLSWVILVAGDPENATAWAALDHQVIGSGPQVMDKSVSDQVFYFESGDLVLDDSMAKIRPLEGPGGVFGVGESGYY
jgi:hypothetical protein